MSAIEVLKNNLRIIDGLEQGEELSWSKESKESFVKSLKEALLALEKQEKLKEWLEKEIVESEKKYKVWADDGEYNEAICLSARLVILKEVLGVLK